jgi:hypothetical protein
MEEIMDDKAVTMTMTMSNQSEPMVNWTGTIEVNSTIAEALKSKVTVNIIDAIKVAQVSIGLNSSQGSRLNSCTYLSSVQDNGCK